MSVWTDNANLFASTPESAVDAERHAGVRDALALIVDGKPGRALYTLVRSVERQARITGTGYIDLHPTCPCDGRCNHGTQVTR